MRYPESKSAFSSSEGRIYGHGSMSTDPSRCETGTTQRSGSHGKQGPAACARLNISTCRRGLESNPLSQICSTHLCCTCMFVTTCHANNIHGKACLEIDLDMIAGMSRLHTCCMHGRSFHGMFVFCQLFGYMQGSIPNQHKRAHIHKFTNSQNMLNNHLDAPRGHSYAKQEQRPELQWLPSG